MANLKCVHCGKQFQTDQGLKVHVGVVHGPKVKKAPGKPGRPRKNGFACNICGKVFGMPMHLGRHMTFSHPGQKAAAAAAPQGVDVAAMTVDALLDLKDAVDSRLAAIAQRMRQANVGL